MSVLKIVLLQQYDFGGANLKNEFSCYIDCISSVPNVLFEKLKLLHKRTIYELLEVNYYDNLPDIAIYYFGPGQCHGQLIHKINKIEPFLVIGYRDHFTNFLNCRRFVYTSQNMFDDLPPMVSTINHTNGIVNVHEIMNNFTDIYPTAVEPNRIRIATMIVIKRLVQDYVNEFITAGISD